MRRINLFEGLVGDWERLAHKAHGESPLLGHAGAGPAQRTILQSTCDEAGFIKNLCLTLALTLAMCRTFAPPANPCKSLLLQIK